ncbi:MAG: hypothetical protein ACI4VQ_02605 [Clostridia bacterium]
MGNTLSFDTDLMRLLIIGPLTTCAKTVSEAAVLVSAAAGMCPSGFSAGGALSGLAGDIASIAENLLVTKKNIETKADELDSAEKNSYDLANLLPLFPYDSLDDNSLAKSLMKDTDRKYSNLFFNSDAYKDACKLISDSLSNYNGMTPDDTYNLLDTYIKNSNQLTTAFDKILELSNIASSLGIKDSVVLSTLESTTQVTLSLREAYSLVGDKIHNDRLYLDANGRVTSDWMYHSNSGNSLFYSVDLQNVSYADVLNIPGKVTSCGTDPIVTLGIIGYLSVDDMVGYNVKNEKLFNPNNLKQLDTVLSNNGCQKITNIEFSSENAAKLEDGDIVFFDYGGDYSADHVQTYRGLSDDGYAMFTNAGSTAAIQSVSPAKSTSPYWNFDTKSCDEKSDLHIWAYRLPDEEITIDSSLLPDNYQTSLTNYSESSVINMDSIIASVDAKVASTTGISNSTNSTLGSNSSSNINKDTDDDNQFAINLSSN